MLPMPGIWPSPSFRCIAMQYRRWKRPPGNGGMQRGYSSRKRCLSMDRPSCPHRLSRHIANASSTIPTVPRCRRNWPLFLVMTGIWKHRRAAGKGRPTATAGSVIWLRPVRSWRYMLGGDTAVRETGNGCADVPIRCCAAWPNSTALSAAGAKTGAGMYTAPMRMRISGA